MPNVESDTDWHLLKIHHAIVTMDLAPDRSGATNGTIGGVLDPGEIQEELRRYLTNLAATAGLVPKVCTDPGVMQAADDLRGGCDVALNGTDDTTKPCDGITIGLGFNATQARLGSVGAPIAYPDECATPPGG